MQGHRIAPGNRIGGGRGWAESMCGPDPVSAGPKAAGVERRHRGGAAESFSRWGQDGRTRGSAPGRAGQRQRHRIGAFHAPACPIRGGSAFPLVARSGNLDRRRAESFDGDIRVMGLRGQRPPLHSCANRPAGCDSHSGLTGRRRFGQGFRCIGGRVAFGWRRLHRCPEGYRELPCRNCGEQPRPCRDDDGGARRGVSHLEESSRIAGGGAPSGTGSQEPLGAGKLQPDRIDALVQPETGVARKHHEDPVEL